MDIQAIHLLNSQMGGVVQTASGGTDFAQVLSRLAGQETTDMDAMFQRAAQETGVPLNLLKAVAKAESAFDPTIVSGAGAMGVMQLMPDTARYLGVDDPFDPAQNIMGGAKFLGQMLDRYDGDVTLALAAYNAGPGNVDKYGGVPPFTETQNYVRRVQEYAGQEFGAITATAGGTAAAQGTSELAGMLASLFPDNSSGGAITQEAAARLCQTLQMTMRAQLGLAMGGMDDNYLLDSDLSGGLESIPDLK